jgi:hypothetical protein
MKVLKRTAIALAALLIILLGVAVWFIWTADARLNRQLAAIRAAGDPVTLADLARKPIPPETNADTYLRRAEPGADAINKLLYPDTNDPVVRKLANAMQNAVANGDGRAEIPLNQSDLDATSESTDKVWEQSYGGWEMQEPRPPMPVRLQKSLKRILSAHAEVIPLLERAAACPDYDAKLDYTLPPSKFMEIPQAERKAASSRSLLDIV